jgi:deoxyhypusine monooxygenase
MVRHEAAEALGALTHTDSVPLLTKFLDDPSEVVRQTCELAIARINWAKKKGEEESITQGMFASVIDPAPPAVAGNVEQLAKALNDQSLPLFERYRAMFRLRDLGNKDAIDALASGFADSSALFRHEVALFPCCYTQTCVLTCVDCVRVWTIIGSALRPCSNKGGGK